MTQIQLSQDTIDMIETAGTVQATWKRIGELLRCFSADKCANYLVNAGYASI
jgi:hypothetical protein